MQQEKIIPFDCEGLEELPPNLPDNSNSLEYLAALQAETEEDKAACNALFAQIIDLAKKRGDIPEYPEGWCHPPTATEK